MPRLHENCTIDNRGVVVAFRLMDSNIPEGCEACPNRKRKQTNWPNYLAALAIAIALCWTIATRNGEGKPHPMRLYAGMFAAVCLLIEVKLDVEYVQDWIEIGHQVKGLLRGRG